MKKYIIIATLFISFLGINFTFAEESTSTTEVKEEAKQLKLNGAKVIGKNKIELEFDSNIDPKSNENDSIDISVKSAGDQGEDFFISDYQIDNSKVTLILENDLISNSKYEIIIYSIEGEDGSTITSGLDGTLEFTTSDLSIYDVKEELNSAGKEEIKKEEIKKEEVKKEEVKKEEIKKEELKQSENLAGKEVKKEEIEKNIEVAAANKKELAKTGPEHVLLAILALILSGLIGYIINQRKKEKI